MTGIVESLLAVANLLMIVYLTLVMGATVNAPFEITYVIYLWIFLVVLHVYKFGADIYP